MTEAEEAKLLKADEGPGRTRPLDQRGGYLVRLGDLLDLRRDDRHGRWVYLRDPKNGEPTEVALSVRGAEALDAITGDDKYLSSTNSFQPLESAFCPLWNTGLM